MLFAPRLECLDTRRLRDIGWPMFGIRPYALIVDREEASRARMAALLRDSGFVVAAFRDGRAALAARPVDIAIIARDFCGAEDGLVGVRQMRDGEPRTKLLFAGSAAALPAAPGPCSGHAVTQPFDKRRFLSAVFELLARDAGAADQREAAEFGLMAARLACLRSRRARFGGDADCDPASEAGRFEATG
jgi:DNA-binding response OmpR family regulator